MLSGGEVRLLGEVDPATEWLMRKALIGKPRLEHSSVQAPSDAIIATP
jgi:hypothetical protein